MTAVISTSGGWALSGLQLGVNEIAASLIVAKAVGSVFSRRNDASLFSALEQHLAVRVRDLPPWLEDLELRREVSVYVGNMRHIPGVGVMEEVGIGQLQGLAILVVLCTKYTESKQSIVGLLEQLLTGTLGDCVSPGDLKSEGLPTTSRMLLRNFVQACIDSDADSMQCCKAKEWMAWLVMHGNISWQPKRLAKRDRKAVITIMSLLFSGLKDSERDTQAGNSTKRPSSSGLKAHDTLQVCAAYATLAAAANGVDAAVECITSSGSFYVPPNTEPRSTTFVTRLWLIQPPASLSGLLWGMNDLSADEDEVDKTYSMTVIFGGTAEISAFIAGSLGFRCGPGDDKFSETLRQLWEAGTELVKQCSWTTASITLGIIKGRQGVELPQPRNELLFRLDTRSLSQEVPEAAIELARQLKNFDISFDKIARPIANCVHSIWRLRSYKDLFENGFANTDLGAAMLFVATAMGVAAVTSLTTVSGGSLSQFALSANAAGSSRGHFLRNFITVAVEARAGCSTSDLLTAAALLWGGLATTPRPSRAISQYGLSDGHVGIVAPHCTVILSILKDPWELVKRGFEGNVIHVCHGAVPLLPRDPVTGSIWGKAHYEIGRTIQTETFEMIESSWSEPPKGDIILSFEPSETDVSAGIFSCWYSGNFICEIDPATVFHNLLRHPIQSSQTIPRNEGYMPETYGVETLQQLVGKEKLAIMSYSSLLKNKIYHHMNRSAVFDCHGYAGWAIFICGCASTGTVYFAREHASLHSAESLVLSSGKCVVLVLFNP